MQVDAQDFLRLVEDTGQLAFFDIEATGLRGDYNSVLCVSVKPYGGKAETFSVKQAGNDQKVVREAKECLEQYDAICGYYSKGFDIPMLNTRLLRWSQDPIKKLFHIDMYYSLKYNLLTARRSQGHLLSWLGTPDQKMSVSAEKWNEVLADTTTNMPEMIKRCESDVAGLEGLYSRTKHLIREIKKG
jgi:DNA polymerase elongation subunit (family B)